MKKIISLGIASAVLAISAVSAFADAAADEKVYAIDIAFDNAAPAAGDIINATVTAGAGANFEDISGVFTFDGVTLAPDTDVTLGAGTVVFNPDENRLAVANTAAYTEGATIVTIPLQVVGDGDISVGFTADEDYANVTVNAATATVAEASEPDESTDSEPVSEPDASEPATSEPDASEPATSEPATSEPATSEPTTTDTENPGTGVALAVVPAIIAGAAVVVAKKRK